MPGGDMRMSERRRFELLRWAILMSVMAWTATGVAQEPANRAEPPAPASSSESVSDSVRELREQVRELQAAVAGMRSDGQRARAETAQLRRELNEVRAGMAPRNAVLSNAVAKSATSTANPEAMASLPNLMEKGASQDQETEDRNEDKKKGGHAASLEEE